jgi:hypothetical protein
MGSPFGGFPLEELTVAVNVTAWPVDEGFGEETSVVVVAATIFSLNVPDVLPVLLESPLYSAVIE